tara:strand:- start:16952 stop:18229 length:1278 start_codon:yes stop_codon:yes gene_type:complete
MPKLDIATLEARGVCLHRQIGQRSTKKFGFQMYSSSFRLTNRDIDLALEAGHLFLIYQPKIELETGRTIGAEAYVRWEHPDYGLMPPGLFLSFFERRERSVDLTKFVIAKAADTMMLWHSRHQFWPIAINLSGADLSDPTLPGTLAAIVGERGLDTCNFALDIPEGVFARNAATSAAVIAEIRRLGFRTALDGGGAVVVPSEYVTPDYFSEVKVSGAAIIRFAHRVREAGLGFIGRRVSLAAAQGLDATAVGVEDEATLSGLTAVGFTAAQGTHICRPRIDSELIGWSFAQTLQSDFQNSQHEDIYDVVEDAPENILYLENPIDVVSSENDFPENNQTPADSVSFEAISLCYEDFELAIPGFDDLEVCAKSLDPVCFFPGRKLLSMLRRRPRHGRRIAGIERPIRMQARRPKPKQKNFLARALGF